MTQTEFIEKFKELTKSGMITDIESYAKESNFSRTKKQSDLNKEDVWEKVMIGKHYVFIKK